jgi:hypothetical protein
MNHTKLLNHTYYWQEQKVLIKKKVFIQTWTTIKKHFFPFMYTINMLKRILRILGIILFYIYPIDFGTK